MKEICKGNFRVSEDAEYEIVNDLHVKLLSQGVLENYAENGKAVNYADYGKAENHARFGNAENRAEKGIAINHARKGIAFNLAEYGTAFNFAENGKAVNYAESGIATDYADPPPKSVKDIVKDMRDLMVSEAEELGHSICDIEAELLAQSLMSDDCDACHVHWLEFHALLESKLMGDTKS